LRLLIIVLILSQFLYGEQVEEKKDKEPVFILPDVIITGESEIKIGAEKKDLLPENYPIPPKETPLMELEFIKGPYLTDDKKTPSLEEKTKGKNNLGEITTYYGTYSNFYTKLVFGQPLNNFNYLINVIKDKKDYFTSSSGYNNFNIYGDVNYTFEKIADVGFGINYYNEILGTPYSNILSFNELKKYFYELNLRGKSTFSYDYSILTNISYNHSDLNELNYKDDTYKVSINTNFNMVINEKKHLPRLNIELRKDSIYGMMLFALLDDKFKFDQFNFTLGVRYDKDKFNFLGKAVYELDNFTNLYIEYAPMLTYPVFRELYKNSILNVNKNLQPQNTWFSILTGVEHKLNKEIPIRFEIYRKDVNNFISLESSNGIGIPVNISEVSLIGFNFKEEWKIFNNFTQTLDYNFVSGVNKNDSNKFITYLPNHSFKLGCNYNIIDWEFNMELEYISERYYRENSSNKLNPYLLLSARVNKNFSDWLNLFVKGENLLNQEYEHMAGYILPKASVLLGINIKFM
jgi:outer membrane cobalamin receptor